MTKSSPATSKSASKDGNSSRDDLADSHDSEMAVNESIALKPLTEDGEVEVGAHFLLVPTVSMEPFALI